MLSCSCPEYDSTDPDMWGFYTPYDFSILNRKRRVRCRSCNELINIGSECLKFERFRCPKSDIEYRIWGDEVSLADWYMCEKCGEIFLNLSDIGYYMSPDNNMPETLIEYHALTGFKPDNQKQNQTDAG